MELLKLKSKPHLSQESKSEAIQCQRKSDNFRRSNLLLRTFAPWCRLVDQARYFNSKKIFKSNYWFILLCLFLFIIEDNRSISVSENNKN